LKHSDELGLQAALGLELLGLDLASPPVRQDEDADMERAEPEHDEPEPGAHAEDEAEVEDDEGSVEHGGEGARRQHVPNDTIARVPADEIADGVLHEERVRQSHEVIDEIHAQLGIENRAEAQEQMRARERRQDLEDHERQRAERDDGECLGRAIGEDAIHHQPGDDGQREAEQLHQRRDDRDLHDRALATEDPPEVVPPDVGVASPAGPEDLARRQDQRDPGELPAELLPIDQPASDGRVDDSHALARDAIEHDEVIERPVQNRASRKCFERFRLELHPSAEETVPEGGVEDRGCARTAGSGTDPLADFRQLHDAAVPFERHR